MRALAAYALCAGLSGLAALGLGYAALRALQDGLGLPGAAPTVGSVLGALAGCWLGCRLVPRGWFPGEAPGE